jgi:hypothetical protein
MTTKQLPILISAAFLSAHIAIHAAPALTIYNQKFAVVRDNIHLDLKSGVNDISYNGATMHLEPDSVVLRDPTGKHNLQILEQNFRADPVTESLLLNFYEGKTIDFEKELSGRDEGKTQIIHGKIIRSGYVPPQGEAEPMPNGSPNPATDQPIIEVDGKLMFHLPGTPLFPALADNAILKPTLTWQLRSDTAGPVESELSYVTGGLSWESDYNLVMPEDGQTIDLVGWVTMNNQSGKSFERAKIKLMAGDVSKIEQPEIRRRAAVYAMGDMAGATGPVVTEKAFDEYHLYTLERPTTLLDRETKQVEFVSANSIKSQPIYVYDGANIGRFHTWNYENIRDDRNYGTQSNPKVWVMREFKNSKENHLGIPLPKGRLRFYRRDADKQMEFVGENTIDHTPADEMIRVATGSAFDIVGERKRTNHEEHGHTLDESFEIKLRNHKKTDVEVRVVEHLYRWPTWKITQKSSDYKKTDDQTIEFRVNVAPDQEQTVTYTAHYSW